MSRGRLPVDAVLVSLLPGIALPIQGHTGCVLFFYDTGEIDPVSDDQIFTIIAVSLGLTVIWVLTSMVFGPF
jgi:hypothetical protein